MPSLCFWLYRYLTLSDPSKKHVSLAAWPKFTVIALCFLILQRLQCISWQQLYCRNILFIRHILCKSVCSPGIFLNFAGRLWLKSLAVWSPGCWVLPSWQKNWKQLHYSCQLGQESPNTAPWATSDLLQDFICSGTSTGSKPAIILHHTPQQWNWGTPKVGEDMLCTWEYAVAIMSVAQLCWILVMD